MKLFDSTREGIWAQGARAGDPLFFSSLYTKTCTRTRSAETADATYARLPRSRSGRRRAQLLRRTPHEPRRHRCEATSFNLCRVTHTHQAGRRRWQGACEYPERHVRASTLKGCCARLFQGPQDFPSSRTDVPVPMTSAGAVTLSAVRRRGDVDVFVKC
jgi:hypothetical protein